MSHESDAREYTRRLHALNKMKDQVAADKVEIEDEERELCRFAFNKLGMVGWREVDRLERMEGGGEC